MSPPRFADFPLRARKRAQTRVALVEALTVRLSVQPLEDVPIAELCAEVGVSLGTFFNYFPSKTHLITHFIQLWTLRVGRLAQQVHAQHDNPLLAIEALFLSTAEQSRDHPKIMAEIIAHQARSLPLSPAEPVELVERLLWLQDDPGAAELPDTGLDALLPQWLGRAVSQGFLPPHTDIPQLVLLVASVFFGVPLLVGQRQPELVGPLYRAQLQLVWAGARNLSPSTPTPTPPPPKAR